MFILCTYVDVYDLTFPGIASAMVTYARIWHRGSRSVC